jgi:DNA (cytosine-5)-methyltransferase 1
VSQDVTGFDMFCGAGGSSTGFVNAGGRLVGAANHWKLAIDTHNTNHPNVDHYLANISLSDPRAYPRTDVLIASPECVNHSSA